MPVKLTRRQFLRRAFWSTAAFGLGGTAYVTLIEPHRVQISHLSIPLPGLPRALDGVTIAHLTDLHRSTLVSRRYLAHCVATVNRLAPDLIVFTGDYLTHARSERARFAYGTVDPSELARECADCMGQARARYGVFATLGNHDHWFDAKVVTAHIERAGIPVLRNQTVTATVRGAPLPVVGLGDLWTEGVNFHQAFAGIADGPAVVLMHNPDAFEHWPRNGADLVLAGHTHGGQVNLPLVGPPIVPSRYGQKYAQGLFRRGNATLYVNRGLGVLWPGVRFNCRPEIAVFHLHCA
jgi:predicted MPP superfamily phosphohydrolase